MHSRPDSASRQDARYWDGVAIGAALPELWYAYMSHLYRGLLDEWLPATPMGFGLKTDLFEEAVSDQPVLQHLGPGSLGIDISPVVARASRRRFSRQGHACRVVVGDLRRLPFAPDSLPYILSGSSLDHFANKQDLLTALGELVTALEPGGVLILTLDSPHNPLLWLRSRLPFALLNRIGLVPYYVGKTLTRQEAQRQLEALGLCVTHISTIGHAPRAPAIWLAHLLGFLGRPWLSTWLLNRLLSFESLRNTPIRFLTGYYIALRAVKRIETKDRAWPASGRSNAVRQRDAVA